MTVQDTDLQDARPLPREQKNSKHYEDLWRTIKLEAAQGRELQVLCPASAALRVKRGVQKRKTKDTPYNCAFPSVRLLCTYLLDADGAVTGVHFSLKHPLPL